MADRTSEFLALCGEAKAIRERHRAQMGSGVGTQLNKPLRSSKTTPAEAAAFTRAASQISKDINVTAQKLGKLTRLVQKNTIFNDPASDINRLVSDIKDDITKLNEQVERAENFINQKRGLVGTQQSVNHSESILSQMKTDLMSTTKNFKDVLMMRQDNMKVQQDRRTLYGRASQVTLAKPLVFKPKDGAAGDSLPRPDGIQQESQPLIAEAEMQQLIPATSYFQSRADAVQQIESHMVDLGQIFNKLATMIQEQGQMVERIDDNVLEVEHNINRGQNQLVQYYNSLSSNQILMMKLFFVLIVFLIFFISFLA